LYRPELIVALIAGCTEYQLGASFRAEPPPNEPAAPDIAHEELRWVDADAGYIHSSGLLSDGRIVTWGNDLCVAASPAPTERFIQMSIGNDGGCGVRTDGTVSCWCCLALEPWAELCTEAPEGDGWIRVENGYAFACAQKNDGRLRCWGNLRDFGTDPPMQPVRDWSIDIDVGCAVMADGAVRCFGADPLWAPSEAPPPQREYTQVVVGRRHGCALDTEGLVHCWGDTWTVEPYPDPPRGEFVRIEGFHQITCGFRADSTVECWYDVDQLNDLDDTPLEADGSPRWEPPAEQFAEVGLGEWDACGVTHDGRAVCWPQEADTDGEVLELPDISTLR
jgi:hypothetical protein